MIKKFSVNIKLYWQQKWHQRTPHKKCHWSIKLCREHCGFIRNCLFLLICRHLYKPYENGIGSQTMAKTQILNRKQNGIILSNREGTRTFSGLHKTIVKKHIFIFILSVCPYLQGRVGKLKRIPTFIAFVLHLCEFTSC